MLFGRNSDRRCRLADLVLASTAPTRPSVPPLPLPVDSRSRRARGDVGARARAGPKIRYCTMPIVRGHDSSYVKCSNLRCTRRRPSPAPQPLAPHQRDWNYPCSASASVTASASTDCPTCPSRRSYSRLQSLAACQRVRRNDRTKSKRWRR